MWHTVKVDPWGLEMFLWLPCLVAVRCISRILASPLQGDPSSRLMQYGFPLPQAETGPMVSSYWSPLFLLFCPPLFPRSVLQAVFRSAPSFWLQVKLAQINLFFVFSCILTEFKPQGWSLTLLLHKKKNKAREPPTNISADMISASCQHSVFLHLVWAVRR